MKRKIETKNYVILLIVIVVTIFAVFYARSWYITGIEYRENNSIMSSTISQINENEITNCLSENPNAVIYASFGEDTEVKDFERKFQKLIIKYSLVNQFLYVNLDTSSDSFVSTLRSFAVSADVSNKVNNTSASIYIFKNGNLTQVVDNADTIGTEQIIKILKEYGVIDGE